MTFIRKHQEIYGNAIEMNNLDNNNNVIDFPVNSNSDSFRFKQNITGQTGNDEDQIKRLNLK